MLETKQAGQAVKTRRQLAKEVLKDKTVVASRALMDRTLQPSESLKTIQASATPQTGQLTREARQDSETNLGRDFVFVSRDRISGSVLEAVVSVETLPEKSFPDPGRIGSCDRNIRPRSRSEKLDRAFRKSAKLVTSRARSAGRQTVINKNIVILFKNIYINNYIYYNIKIIINELYFKYKICK
jgi:hypothetical protein